MEDILLTQPRHPDYNIYIIIYLDLKLCWYDE